MSGDLKAYHALQALANKSLSAAQQLPDQKDLAPQWSGVGFSLFGINFVVSMGELNEMLEVPSLTRLPGVQSWVKGVANVRGRLLPVFDLAAYFGGVLNGVKKQQRLLVIDRDHIYAGLWVDKVFGMQYFPVDSKTDELPKEVPESVYDFVDGCFVNGTDSWTVFHPLRLMDKPNFLDVVEA